MFMLELANDPFQGLPSGNTSGTLKGQRCLERLINHSSPGNNKIKIISAPKARPHRAAGAHEAHIGPDRALRRVNDAFIRVPTAEYTRAVHLSVLPLNSATEGAEFKFVLRTARQVERMSVAQDRREG